MSNYIVEQALELIHEIIYKRKEAIERIGNYSDTIIEHCLKIIIYGHQYKKWKTEIFKKLLKVSVAEIHHKTYKPFKFTEYYYELFEKDYVDLNNQPNIVKLGNKIENLITSNNKIIPNKHYFKMKDYLSIYQTISEFLKECCILLSKDEIKNTYQDEEKIYQLISKKLKLDF